MAALRKKGGEVVLCENNTSQSREPCIPCWMNGQQRKGSPTELLLLGLQHSGASCHRCVVLENLLSVHSSGASRLKLTCSSYPRDT